MKRCSATARESSWESISRPSTGPGSEVDAELAASHPEKGSGLGLAMVQRIVRGLRGAIAVDGDEGRGSMFRVYLPRLDETEEAAPGRKNGTSGGTGHVLFVDDQPALAKLGGQQLESFGYRVTVAVGGRQALELFQADPAGFDLMIADQTMPELSGTDLAQEILAIRPGFPIILVTGYSEVLDGEKAAQIGVRALLFKPLKKSQLAEAVHAALKPALPGVSV